MSSIEYPACNNLFNTESSISTSFVPWFVKLTELATLKNGVLFVKYWRSCEGISEYFPKAFCLTFTCSLTQGAKGVLKKLLAITLSI